MNGLFECYFMNHKLNIYICCFLSEGRANNFEMIFLWTNTNLVKKSFFLNIWKNVRIKNSTKKNFKILAATVFQPQNGETVKKGNLVFTEKFDQKLETYQVVEFLTKPVDSLLASCNEDLPVFIQNFIKISVIQNYSAWHVRIFSIRHTEKTTNNYHNDFFRLYRKYLFRPTNISIFIFRRKTPTRRLEI